MKIEAGYFLFIYFIIDRTGKREDRLRREEKTTPWSVSPSARTVDQVELVEKKRLGCPLGWDKLNQFITSIFTTPNFLHSQKTNSTSANAVGHIFSVRDSSG